MNRDMVLNQKTPSQEERARLAELPSAPYPDTPVSGVLLSDQIEFYCKKYKLLYPFKPENIKPANYELRVGLKYAVAGKAYDLKPGELLTIPKFEVAVIEILETVNIPHFIIGRWNIRTKWAYKGLIWVGGPQVDAGFRGLLLCPIWNLSNQDFTIRSGEEIAIIDFEFTTPPTGNSKQYPWATRSRFLFDDYEKPRSALVTDALTELENLRTTSVEDSKKFERILDLIRSRFDNVTAVTFTALGILTAAIALTATKPLNVGQYWWDPTILVLSATTTVIALVALVKDSSTGVWKRKIPMFGLFLAAVAIALLIHRGQQQARHVRDAEIVIQQLAKRVEALENARQSVPQSQH